MFEGTFELQGWPTQQLSEWCVEKSQVLTVLGFITGCSSRPAGLGSLETRFEADL